MAYQSLVNVRGLKEALADLDRFKELLPQQAGHVLGALVRATAHYAIYGEGGTRHSPAYTGNFVSNWQVTLGGKPAEYQPLDNYRYDGANYRTALSTEAFSYDFVRNKANHKWYAIHHGGYDYDYLAAEAYNAIRDHSYKVVWNSKVTLANPTPYQVTSGGKVEGISDLSGSYFSVSLREINQQARTVDDLEEFALRALPHIVDLVLGGKQARVQTIRGLV